MRAGVFGILVLVDGNTDGEAHLITVDDQRGVVAQFQLHARQFCAQIRAELRIARVVTWRAAVRAAGVTAGGEIHHAVSVWGGENIAHCNGLGLDHAQRINVSQGLFLLLHAKHEGAAPNHGAEERIHSFLTSVAFNVFKPFRAAVERYVLPCHGNGVTGNVVRINDRCRLVEIDEKIAHKLWRPGVGLRGVYPCNLPVLVLHRLGNRLVKHASGVAAQRNVHIAQCRSFRTVHGMAVGVCSVQIAVALLFRRQRCKTGLVRDSAGQCRKDLCPVAAAGADRNVIRLGAQRIEDLQIILMDDFCPVFILGNHRLEEGIWIVAV